MLTGNKYQQLHEDRQIYSLFEDNISVAGLAHLHLRTKYNKGIYF